MPSSDLPGYDMFMVHRYTQAKHLYLGGPGDTLQVAGPIDRFPFFHPFLVGKMH